jgi:hypothetical protein
VRDSILCLLPIALHHSRYFFGNLLAIIVALAIVIMARFIRSRTLITLMSFSAASDFFRIGIAIVYRL